MIYRILLKNTVVKMSAAESHYWGEELLAYGLFKERGIIYRNEPVLRNPWGKTSLKNYPSLHYNISHSENCIGCVISDTYPVGIDIERIRSFNPYAATRVCSPEELQRIYSQTDRDREFFRYWTLKESYIKAIGKGLSYPMKDAIFEVESDGKIRFEVSDCSFILMEDIEGFITAVCFRNISERQ